MAEIKQQQTLGVRPQTTATTGGGTVAVACKVPMGFILQLFRMEETDIPVMGGGVRREKQARAIGEQFVLNGTAYPQNKGPQCRIVGDFAITEGCPKDLWEQWARDNAKHDMVRNGMIFAGDLSSVVARATEQAARKSGVERLDPEHLPSPRIKPTNRDEARLPVEI